LEVLARTGGFRRARDFVIQSLLGAASVGKEKYGFVRGRRFPRLVADRCRLRGLQFCPVTICRPDADVYQREEMMQKQRKTIEDLFVI